jgi:CheY-like chemotaxis protein
MHIGSRFETIPLSEVPISATEQSDETHQPTAPVVLVVDDEEIIADTRSAILSGWGYSVLTAYSAEDALEIARRDPPSFLVSDVHLGRMNGVDLAFAIRSIATDCQVVLFSGDADSLALLATARNSTHNFTLLQKPIHPAHLRPFFPDLDGATCPNQAEM